jgi:outer membrane autotransporter protein
LPGRSADGCRGCGRWRTSPFDAPRTVSVWGVANLWHEFLGQPATSFSSADGHVPPIANLRDSWGEIGFGASVQVSARASLFGSVDYASTFAGDTHSYGEKVGLLVNW